MDETLEVGLELAFGGDVAGHDVLAGGVGQQQIRGDRVEGRRREARAVHEQGRGRRSTGLPAGDRDQRQVARAAGQRMVVAQAVGEVDGAEHGAEGDHGGQRVEREVLVDAPAPAATRRQAAGAIALSFATARHASPPGAPA